MRAVDTPIGKVVVLPPCLVCDAVEAVTGDDPICVHPAVGDTVDVDEDCPTCHGQGWHPWPNGAGDETTGCAYCDCSGTVSVPHVVTEVLPIVKSWRPGTLMLWAGAPEHFDPTIPVVDAGDPTRPFELPDAQPGGVVLIVERAK